MARNKSREKHISFKKEVVEEPMEVAAPPAEEEEAPVKPEKQNFDATLLTCDVCLDIMHTPVNCSPCNHKFCASCIYRWLDDHYTCPKCRYLVKEITKDSFASQICEEFFKHNPEGHRNQQAKDAQDRVELEYLEKLIDRSRTRRFTEFSLRDEELDQMDPNGFEDIIRNFTQDAFIDPNRPFPPPDILAAAAAAHPIRRRLFLSISKRFREKEWELRANRLREKFNLPPRPAPPPENEGRVPTFPFDPHNLARLELLPDGSDSDLDSDELVPPVGRGGLARFGNRLFFLEDRILNSGRRRTPQQDAVDLVDAGNTPPRNARPRAQPSEQFRNRTARLRQDERERRNRTEEQRRVEQQGSQREARVQARQQRARAQERAAGNAPTTPQSASHGRRRQIATPRSARSEPYNLRSRT